MHLTVAEALNLSGLEGVQVLAGEDGLGKPITGVTVIDSPDLRFLKGGELVLSTLFLYKEEPSKQVQLLDELGKRGVSALGIKERYIVSISDLVREEADRLCMPLMAIPAPVAWVEIINSVLKESLGRQAVELENSWRIHREFIDLALNGRGLRDLVNALAEMTKRPVLLKETVTGEVFRARVGPAPNAERRPVDSKRDVEPGPWAIGHNEDHEVVDPRSDSFRISPRDGETPRVVCPIRSGAYSGGWVVIYEGQAKLNEWDQIALQHAATVAALEIEKLRALNKQKRSMRDEFLNHLLNGDFESEDSARDRAWRLGWELVDRYAAVAFRVIAPASGKLLFEEGGRASWRVADLLEECGLPRQSLIGVDYAERPLLLYPILDGPPPMGDIEVAREVGRLIGIITRGRSNIELLAGVGRPKDNVLSVRESYEEAVAALELAPTVPRTGSVVQFRELGVYRLVGHNSAKEEATFVDDMIGPLVEHDRRHGTQLVPTLKSFLECGGARKTAKALHLHHNTVRYRLSQVEKLCGVDLNVWRDRFNLQLAISLLMRRNLSS